MIERPTVMMHWFIHILITLLPNVFNSNKKDSSCDDVPSKSTVYSDDSNRDATTDTKQLDDSYMNVKNLHDLYLVAKNGRLGELLGKYNSYVSMDEISLSIDAGDFHLVVPYKDIDKTQLCTMKGIIGFSAVAIESYSIDGTHIVGEYKNRKWGRFFCCINSCQKDMIILDYAGSKRLIFNDIDGDFMKEMNDFLSSIRNTRMNTA